MRDRLAYDLFREDLARQTEGGLTFALQPEMFRWIVRVQAVPVAMLDMAFWQGGINLNHILVAPVQRQRGYARAILAVLLRVAAERNLTVSLYVHPDDRNGPNVNQLVRFYRSVGFRSKSFDRRSMIATPDQAAQTSIPPQTRPGISYSGGPT